MSRNTILTPSWLAVEAFRCAKRLRGFFGRPVTVMIREFGECSAGNSRVFGFNKAWEPWMEDESPLLLVVDQSMMLLEPHLASEALSGIVERALSAEACA